jgi:hypothetical protein
MKLAKTLAVVACAGLLSAGIIGSARHAYAQDAPDQSEGAWGVGTPDSTDQAASPDVVKPPLDISGCWQGTVKDKHDGKGAAFFEFDQSGSNLLDSSTYDFEWGDGSYAYGPLTGTVSSKGFKFSGPAGQGCSVSGSAKRHGLKLKGKVHFHQQCAKFFGGGPLSISRCIM